MARGTGISLRTFGRSASAIARSLKGRSASAIARSLKTRSASAIARTTAIVLFIAFGTSPSFGQVGTATILGVVHDTTGALIPGVNISIKHLDSGYTRNAITSETGNYSVPT